MPKNKEILDKQNVILSFLQMRFCENYNYVILNEVRCSRPCVANLDGMNTGFSRSLCSLRMTNSKTLALLRMKKSIFGRINAISTTLLILVFLALSTGLFSKPRSVGDSTFSFTAELGLGYNTDLNSLLTEIQLQNFSPSLRILWKPDHRLNIGLQTARINIMDIQKNEPHSEFGSADIRASLKGYPALLIINMNLYGIGIYGGLGTTYVTSAIEAIGTKVSVNNWYYTYYLGIGYNYFFSDSFGIGFEADVYTFSLMQIRSGGLKLKLNYDFLNW